VQLGFKWYYLSKKVVFYMEWSFDKETVKVLRYIYLHKGVTSDKLARHFKKQEDIGLLLINLTIDRYLVAEDESKNCFFYELDKKPWIVKAEYKWHTTPKSNLVVQSDSANLWKWLIPLIFSAVSLGLSGINFILNWIG